MSIYFSLSIVDLSITNQSCCCCYNFRDDGLKQAQRKESMSAFTGPDSVLIKNSLFEE